MSLQGEETELMLNKILSTPLVFPKVEISSSFSQWKLPALQSRATGHGKVGLCAAWWGCHPGGRGASSCFHTGTSCRDAIHPPRPRYPRESGTLNQHASPVLAALSCTVSQKNYRTGRWRILSPDPQDNLAGIVGSTPKGRNQDCAHTGLCIRGAPPGRLF